MTADPMAEDLEHIEKNLYRLYKLALESLEELEKALTTGQQVDLSANTTLADHLKDTIYTETLFFIAKWQPLGHKLLYAEALIKVSYDLFRIVRYANEISRTTIIAGGIKAEDTVVETLRNSRIMVEKAFKAFTSANYRLAEEVEQLDEEIDKTYIDALRKIAQRDPIPRSEALSCIILRQIERISDHATYIARETMRISKV